VGDRGEEDTVAPDTQLETTHVSRQEAARLAGVHVNTIRLWEESGRVHPRKLENGRIMIPMSELEDVVKARRSAEAGDPEHRLIELEAEVGILRSENAFLKEAYTRLQQEHAELLSTVIDLARGKERAP
jgi:hypothetical protein